MPEPAGELESAGYPRFLAELLARRGVGDADAAEAFLHPALDQLHDPHRLAGLDAALGRLATARERRETVAVVGDYDVDGVSGTAILTAVLRACGLEVMPILPHRFEEGYGFQPVHAERARERGCGLIVTVDCGTRSISAARAALAAGVDVVVTDHHLPGEPLPRGVVQINPRQKSCRYPFAHLSGAGLAFKLALAFAASCGREIDPRLLVRVACLGTIADLVPLVGENRVIAALGLDELCRTRSAGLQALSRIAGLQPPYTAADVGFRLGPRLNAAGRMDSADAALELLLCRDPRRSFELALELDRRNRERQGLEGEVTAEARRLFSTRSPLPPILVGWSDSWHRGVIGIAAGRLARELHRPTLLLSVEGDVATGSGRSAAGIDLHDFLDPWRERLVRFGGHAQAVGLTVELERLEELRGEWETAAAAHAERVAVRRLEYELEIDPGELGPELGQALARLEPHGSGNPRPLVRVRGPLRLAAAPRRFGNGHLSAEARSERGDRIGLIGWGWQEREASLAGAFEALGTLVEDRYRGETVLRLVDSRPSSRAREPAPERDFPS